MAADTASRIGVVEDDFASLVRTHDRSLRALAFRVLGDPDLMDDALQDAYAKALRSYGTFRGDSDVRTWLYRIVHNACVDVQRAATKHRHVDIEGAPLPPVDDDVSSIGSSDLAAALAALPPDQRAVVLLVDADGFDYGEAADVLGVAVGTVASRLSRARAALRRDLEARR